MECDDVNCRTIAKSSEEFDMAPEVLSEASDFVSPYLSHKYSEPEVTKKIYMIPPDDFEGDLDEN